ncbi:MAG TPA: PQQ-binding-like beta-propeller repeat protein, partial [Pirellulaceae bacterium]|nr:PQQ-binding-like beta-propeller repeat protein [Pirellulaceae bacterium]
AVFLNALRTPDEQQLLAELEKKQRDEAAKEAVPEEEKKTVPAEVAPTEQPAEPAVGTGTDTKPVEPSVVAPPAKPVEVTILAERYLRSNLQLDNHEFGTSNHPVLHASGKGDWQVDYEFSLPKDQKYYLHLRYASSQARPVQATLNDKKLDKPLANNATGGDRAAELKWFNEGQHTFRKGKNKLKLSSKGDFPHLNRLVISTSPKIDASAGATNSPQELAKVSEPWDEAFAQAPPSLADVYFDDFAIEKSLPQVPDLLRWFETVPNQQRRIGETYTKRGKCGELDGVFRLRAPWRENVSLRLALENYNRLRMHFYNGTSGTTLVYYQDEGFTWCAYRTTRKDDQTPLPETLAITATDHGRAQRSELRFGGPFDIRWQAGELLLSRGDVVLLRAPLKDPPQSVYFDGRVAFHGIALVPTKDALPQEVARPIAAEIDRPADLNWHHKLAGGAQVMKHADGSIELVADNAKEAGFISAPLGQIGLGEVIVELEGIAPGAGVFLSADKTRNLATVRFAKNNRANPPALAAQLRRDEYREGDLSDYRERPSMHISKHKQYVRLIGGAGTLRYALSSDGLHWAEWEEIETGQPAGATSLVLDYVPHTPGCRIKLNKITIRKLPTLMAQASATLLPDAPILTNLTTPSIGQWLTEVSAQQPGNVNASEWRRTCAIRALAAGCDAELGQRLVRMLLDDAEARRLPPQELLALYNEAFLLLDTRNNGALAQECWKRYFDLAQRAFRELGARPYSLVRQAAIASPVWFRHNYSVGDEPAIRLELVQLLYGGQWEEALRFCKQLRFYQQQQRVPLIDWAEAVAIRQLPGRTGVESTIQRQRSSWRPLLVEELSKDAYNAVAEMQAVLDSDAFDDAARMITSISPDAVAGVAPHGRDRQLLVSLPSAIRLAVRDYPQLQTVMNQKFGPLAELRVKQSINANNVGAVELAAVQFEATEAAAEAHRWLGDRALASGWFARAMAEYERAVQTATPNGKHDLLARMRLAAALQGVEFGAAVTRPVVLGEMSVSASEFEAIVADMRQANAGSAQLTTTTDKRVWPAPAPTGYEVAVRSRLDGLVGGDPNAEVTRDINNLRIGWCERQISTAVEGNLLYVSNRFQVAAYDLNNGQRVWQSAQLPGNIQRSRDWTLIPMRPLITSRFIYARFLYGPGPTLACLDKATGKLLWNSEQRNNEFLVSDPLLVHNQLVGLTLTRSDQGQSQLQLTTFDAESGEPLAQRNLIRLNDVWWTRHGCEVTALDDAIVATLGGVTLCCDLGGNVRWIRKQISLPPEEEPGWVRQYFERPLFVARKAYLTQPGVRSIECVDPETGRLFWSRVLPNLESLIGHLDGKLLVRTENAFLALNANDGEILWQHERPPVFDAVLLGGAGGFVYVQKQNAKDRNDRFYPRLVWLDPNTGASKGSFALPQLENNEPHFGPLLSHNDRLWSFSANGNNEANRELVELTPKAELPITPGSNVVQRDPWNSNLDPALRTASERLLPNLALLTAGVNGESGQRDEAFGERDVLGLCTRPSQPILFASEISPAAGSQPKLKLRFNFRGDNVAAKMTVQCGSETVWSQTFDQNAQPQQWRDIDVDLSKLAGKTGTLVVRMEFTSPQGEMSTYWKRLEVTP